jgi:hypothetical protein
LMRIPSTTSSRCFASIARTCDEDSSPLQEQCAC